MRRVAGFQGCCLLAAAVIIAAAQPALAWDCWGGWNPNQECTAQASSCGSCGACCTIIFECRIFNGKNRHVAMSEYGACNTHCLTDWCS